MIFLNVLNMIQTKDFPTSANSPASLTNLKATCYVNNIFQKHVWN